MKRTSDLTALGPGPEFDRIRALWQRMGDRVRGAGDDAAVVELGGTALAVTCDLTIEGQHFRRDWLSAREIGWRATVAALSDLAAMAADPLGVVVSIGMPAADAGGFVGDVADGVRDAVEFAGAAVWGGDLTRSEQLVIDVTCIGRAEQPVRRSGARPGDILWVTGSLGGPGAALAAWRESREPDPAHRERFAHPLPRLREAHWLRERGARASIDLSDGLAGDAAHLAAASEVGCRIDVERVPLIAGVSWEDGIVSGEEYELLVAVGAGDLMPEDVDAFEEMFGIPLTAVGEVSSGGGLRFTRGGRLVSVGPGFSHF